MGTLLLIPLLTPPDLPAFPLALPLFTLPGLLPVRPPEFTGLGPAAPPREPPPPGDAPGPVPPPVAPPPAGPPPPGAPPPPRACGAKDAACTNPKLPPPPNTPSQPGAPLGGRSAPLPGKPPTPGLKDGELKSPRTSIGYTATLARLQTSIAAVSSERPSMVSGKPELNSTTILRPGTS